MKLVFLVNPRAGRGRGAPVAAQLGGLLASRGVDADVRRTTAPRQAIAMARDAARDADVVVAVGGDGTAHEVVNGIAGSETALGVIPVGSGNDLAFALGLPRDPAAALDVILHGRTRTIDLARYDGGWFVNSLGLGFEAQVTLESRRIRRLRGFAIYLWAVARALRGLRCPYLRIRADGEILEGRSLLLCIGNGPRVGGGFRLTPDARNDDGWLDLCLVEAMSRTALLGLLPRSLGGTHVRDPRVRMLRAREIDVACPEGFPFHVDGEIADTACRQLSVRIVPRALNVRVPRP
jgi:YegS/Rv2252/BmrU family lipid kinase